MGRNATDNEGKLTYGLSCLDFFAIRHCMTTVTDTMQFRAKLWNLETISKVPDRPYSVPKNFLSQGYIRYDGYPSNF
jgi:hypothetical protein